MTRWLMRNPLTKMKYQRYEGNFTSGLTPVLTTDFLYGAFWGLLPASIFITFRRMSENCPENMILIFSKENTGRQ